MDLLLSAVRPLCYFSGLATHCNAIVATGSELPGESYDVLSSLLWKFWDTEAIGISADSTDDSSDQTLLESTILATTLR